MNTESITEALSQLQHEIHKTAKEKGWWDSNPNLVLAEDILIKAGHSELAAELHKEFGGRNFGEAIALMHSELSESLEGDRNGDIPDDKIPAFSMKEAELADTMIRIFDYAEGSNLDVIGAMIAKVEMNKGRPYKHGGKKY